MGSVDRHFLTVEQIADRWNTDPARVAHLLHRNELPRALLITGPIRLLLRDDSGRPYCLPPRDTDGMHARLLISTPHLIPGQWLWPLRQVRQIYAFADGGRLGRLSLRQYCLVDCVRGLGWKVECDRDSCQIEGLETALIDLQSLVDYEARSGIQASPNKRQAEASRLRDRRKQRCRVAAAILWRTDASLTLVSVFRHPWVQEEACEGQPPTEKTFREWVKDLNPDRRPGRRRKHRP